MRFANRNLMVNAVPGAGQTCVFTCSWGYSYPQSPVCAEANECSFTCLVITTAMAQQDCDFTCLLITGAAQSPESNIAAIDQLKQELQTALQVVEATEKAVSQSSKQKEED